jgi:hypothetical protein
MGSKDEAFMVYLKQQLVPRTALFFGTKKACAGFL